MKSVLKLAAFITMLSGCDYPSDGALIDGFQPYAFQQYEEHTVKIGASTAIYLPRGAEFGEIKAAIDGDGLIYACGFMSSVLPNQRGMSHFLPFVGLLNKNRSEFDVVKWATTKDDFDAVYWFCKLRGMNIEPPS